MTADNDIVNRLRALSRCEHSDLSVGDEAAAEIERLRGEVESLRGQIHDEIAANLAFREAGGALPDEDMPTFCARLLAERDAAIAPAEAKGDSEPPEEIYIRYGAERYALCDLQETTFDDLPLYCARPGELPPLMEDGGAVAWRTRHRDVDWSFTTRPHPRDLAAGIWEPLYTHPPAAQVQAAPQEVDRRWPFVESPGEFAERLRAAWLPLIEAALRLPAVADWQPIDTAPEGSWFLAHSEKGWIGVVRRADPDYAPGEGWFEDEHTEYVHPGWLTHWQPLPAAPRHEPGEGA